MSDPVKGQASRLYGTARWQRLREAILLRDSYTCQVCGVILRDGTTDDRAAVVDHKRPASMRPDLFHDHDNLWSVCRQCHDGTLRRIEASHNDADKIAEAKARIHLGAEPEWRA